ncbi:MAG: flagellar export chaperone FlgN [Muribaculaceae bacterium]|nr:flagellar export chaperone FlgN [Roseburia sp.]MCM1429866.1 flagellar export chaperone FlgN [Muribaculaceae bacterium]MCM1492917.1 flagellar export chaperone FlgN [Muribaculaceae bacterium]
MAETYIAIMLQSLGRKEAVLTEIARLNDIQKEQLTDDNCPVEKFDATVEDKSRLIEQLEQLDNGFEKLYAQVAEELDSNREAYAEEIRKMQELIRKLTDKSVMIQAQEARNKNLMMQKFSTVKERAKSVRMNSKAITGYYNTMDRTRYMDPQFLETKR